MYILLYTSICIPMDTTELQNILLRAPYLAHLALRKRPFCLTPDPAFYFDSQTHSEALRGLEAFLRRQPGFALIYGDVGTGKTLLCRRFLEGLNGKAYNAGLVLNPMMSVKEFLAEALRAFDLTPRSHATQADMVEALRSLVTTEERKGRQSVLAIDEAQLLSDDLLDLLATLSDTNGTAGRSLHVVLFAQQELVARLIDRRMRYLRGRITMTHCLQPLTLPEVGPYIMHRLATAGSRGQVRFDEDAVERIYRASGGYARVVNSLSDHCLLVLGELSRTTVDRKIVDRVLKEEGIDAAHGRKPPLKERLKIVYLVVLGIIFALAVYRSFVLLQPTLHF